MANEKSEYMCIKIFGDGHIEVTDSHDETVPPDEKPDILPGPSNTYDQAVWYSGSPICFWYRGQRYCINR
ncbi:MAG: hypothetical protein U9R17_13260 [Thermodesulfobacteriota bacterium]|nr:hypothetical protein [Thermodesulfobacteriota bacterium]